MTPQAPEAVAPEAAAEAAAAAEAKPPRGRGRDLAIAVPVAVGLIALVLASVLFSPWPFVGLVCVAVVLALWELRGAFAHQNIDLPLIPLAAGAVGTQLAAAFSGPQGLVVGYFVTAAAAMAWRLLEGDYRKAGYSLVRDLYAIAFAATYLPLLAGFVVLLGFEGQGRWLVIILIALPVASDTGGFFAGTYAGKHPLAPSVSPKKTWEGMGGSVIAAVIVGVVATLALRWPWYWGVAMGVVGVAAGTLGDLSESLLKRSLGLKDMGSLLPGHGGVLDRVDSILMAAPFAFIATVLAAQGVFG